MTSLYTYVHVRTRSPQNFIAIKRMCKQCVPGTLSPPPPPRLGTRLDYLLIQIVARLPLNTNCVSATPRPPLIPLTPLVWLSTLFRFLITLIVMELHSSLLFLWHILNEVSDVLKVKRLPICTYLKLIGGRWTYVLCCLGECTSSFLWLDYNVSTWPHHSSCFFILTKSVSMATKTCQSTFSVV